MKNQGAALTFFVLFSNALSSCGPGFYEQKLNSKNAGHIEKIQALNESIAVAESVIQKSLPPEIDSQTNQSSSFKSSFKAEERGDFLLFQRQYEVDEAWLISHANIQGEKLISALRTDNLNAISKSACIRIPAENFQFAEAVSNSNRQLSIKPSTVRNENRPSQRSGGAFGYPLESLIHPQSFVVVPHGNTRQIKAAFDPDQKVLQLQIVHNQFENPASEKIQFRDRTNSPSNELYTMAIPDPKPPSTQRHTVRLPLSQWLAVAAIPLANDPDRISLHFLKAIEVN